jgi:hypothetical protein
MAGLWRRMGLILAPPQAHPWWLSHAQMPSILPLSDNLWRIYFSARASENRSRVLAVDVDPGASMAIQARHDSPLFDRGERGAFDHAGVLPSCAVATPETVRLYYVGLVERRDVRAQAEIGLATAADGLTFTRAFPGPVHGIGPHDPYFTSAPMAHRRGAQWRLYYVGGTAWSHETGAEEPAYQVRLARSEDGQIFSPLSEQVIPWAVCASPGQGRPWVAALKGQERLWISLRGERFREPGAQAYRLASCPLNAEGLACGPIEPVVFENPPKVDEFDSWMQAYACVVPYKDDLIMVYNGDGFGASGFGWAVMPGGARP